MYNNHFPGKTLCIRFVHLISIVHVPNQLFPRVRKECKATCLCKQKQKPTHKQQQQKQQNECTHCPQLQRDMLQSPSSDRCTCKELCRIRSSWGENSTDQFVSKTANIILFPLSLSFFLTRKLQCSSSHMGNITRGKLVMSFTCMTHKKLKWERGKRQL